jgi:hypothetical protein
MGGSASTPLGAGAAARADAVADGLHALTLLDLLKAMALSLLLVGDWGTAGMLLGTLRPHLARQDPVLLAALKALPPEAISTSAPSAPAAPAASSAASAGSKGAVASVSTSSWFGMGSTSASSPAAATTTGSTAASTAGSTASSAPKARRSTSGGGASSSFGVPVAPFSPGSPGYQQQQQQQRRRAEMMVDTEAEEERAAWAQRWVQGVSAQQLLRLITALGTCTTATGTTTAATGGGGASNR